MRYQGQDLTDKNFRVGQSETFDHVYPVKQIKWSWNYQNYDIIFFPQSLTHLLMSHSHTSLWFTNKKYESIHAKTGCIASWFLPQLQLFTIEQLNRNHQLPSLKKQTVPKTFSCCCHLSASAENPWWTEESILWDFGKPNMQIENCFCPSLTAAHLLWDSVVCKDARECDAASESLRAVSFLLLSK